MIENRLDENRFDTFVARYRLDTFVARYGLNTKLS